MRCGWLTDRFGLSRQIIRRSLLRHLQTDDDAVEQRVTTAMMGTVKLDGPAFEAAAKS